MTLPTCAVTCSVADDTGAPLAGATITARLDRFEVYNGYVVPELVEVQTDATGAATLNLWPNELGATQSSYTVRILAPNGKTLRTTATVPNVPTIALHLIAGLPAYEGKPDGQLAIDAAVAAATQAVAAKEAAEDARDSASGHRLNAQLAQQAAQDAADLAEAAAVDAAASEAAATSAAAAALSSQQAAALSASTATTKAGEASSSATSAAGSASTATTKAGEAASSATDAAGSASTATTKAGEAASSATSAAGSASTATTKASEAASSASAAAGSASTATTKASEAASSASSAAASYDAFDDRYLGAKSSDPTLDNDGQTLLTGALYWNTASAQMRVWSGSAWVVAYVPSLQPIVQNKSVIDANVTVQSGYNAASVGPITIADGVTVTVENNANWSIQ